MILSYPTLDIINHAFKTHINPAFEWRDSSYSIYHRPDLSSYHPDISGLDIPVLITPEKIQHNEIIVLLGQDPMRSISKMSNLWAKDVLSNNFIVGLPFGAHDAKRNVSNIWCDDTSLGEPHDGIITLLLKTGYSVYLTNSYKIYEGTINEKGKQVPSMKHNKDHKLFHMNVVNDELLVLTSKHVVMKVVTFGTVAKTFIDDLNMFNQFNVSYIEHPSGVNRYWNGYTYEEKINTIIKAII